MTSRKLVKKTLEFDNPARVPRDLWLLPWAEKRYPEQVKQILNDFPLDTIGCPNFYKNHPKTVGDMFTPGVYIDEWGCVFKNIQEGVVGEVKEPLVKTWDDLDKVRAPEEMLTVNISKVNDFCRDTDKFVLSMCYPRPFEQLQFIRTSEVAYTDLATMPDGLKGLLKILHQFYIKMMELWANTNVDTLLIMDDWGSQNSLLISPQLWRSVFKPLYKEYIDIAHSHSKKIFMHSDGYIIDIIPDLIELGLDALNSQIFCMDVKELGRRFKGKLTFWGEIDRQHILAYGLPDDVVNAVRLVKDSLYHNGGVIAQCEFGPGAKPENIRLVFQSWGDLKN
jgi:uroporphyrinogen decarboxylase